MATKYRCDNCKKEWPKVFWKGKTHIVRLENGKEYLFDICKKCEGKLTQNFLGVVGKFFKLENVQAWKIKGDNTTKIWD